MEAIANSIYQFVLLGSEEFNTAQQVAMTLFKPKVILQNGVSSLSLVLDEDLKINFPLHHEPVAKKIDGSTIFQSQSELLVCVYLEDGYFSFHLLNNKLEIFFAKKICKNLEMSPIFSDALLKKIA